MNAAAWTAVGTIALAVMTLAAVVVTIVITTQDRRRTDNRLRDERQYAQDREQLAQASAVEVVPNVSVGGGTGVSRLTAFVTNLGSYTITQVETQFSCNDETLIPCDEFHIIGTDGFPGPIQGADLDYGTAYTGILIRGKSMQFWSGSIKNEHLSRTRHPVVRWTDWLGQRWEHRKGHVCQIDDRTPWSP